MATFTNDGVEIAYDDLAPNGPSEHAVLLVHGFASNRLEGWRRMGWLDAFQRRGARTVALDLRGHGESGKPRDSQAYGVDTLAGDVLALMDHLGLGSVDLFGYSMGARVAFAVAQAAPARITNLILGGVGGRMLEDGADGDRPDMGEAMLAADPTTITDPLLRSFRHFADEQGEDRQALAAFVTKPVEPIDLAAARGLSMPSLVVAGARDRIAGDPAELAAILPAGHAVTVPACDHFSAIPHALTKGAVFDFLDGLLDDPFERRW